MPTGHTAIIGCSDEIIQLTKMLSLCAGSDASILIQGESGSGKEVVTRELHRLSKRCNESFIGINCAAIPAQLLESELFGHKKGAFSGAIADRIGRFQLAHLGTLFLDEIGDMPLELQAKLLRVLEEREVVPLGASAGITIDVRIVAATHQDLEGMVSRGEFREDLYHRLNVIPILIPPLRQRRADIPELCLYFATKFSDKRSISFTPETLELLSKYDWPGNVREVANLVKRLSVLSSSDSIDLYNIPDALLPKMLLEIRNDFASKVSSHDHHVEGETQKISQSAPPNDSSDGFEEESELPQPPIPAEKSNACSATEVERIIRLSQSINQIPDSGIETKNLLQEIETNLIRAALDQSEGNVSQAAKLLKIGRTTLIQKLDKHRND
ncbi:MAG: sigma-54-dependent Fis family transcriptional regulator [Gammaproteobacteria bacterium]|nr:sigma-54-dependent Fis family transcriptional regulator [Gammaproteobacteria bacterium]